MMLLPPFAALVLAATTANAHGINPNHNHLAKRQATTSSASAAASAGTTTTAAAATGTGTAVAATGLETSSATVSGVPALSAITFGMTSGTTYAATTTYASGAEPSISGASSVPGLPAFAFTSGSWPALDKVPPTDSDEVTEWMKELDGYDIPDLEPTTDGTCASDPAFAANASARGWWTCGHTTRDTDITVCDEKFTWGVSFDDGPSIYTGKLLQYLDEKDINATFFVVGSRVISYPDMLREEYMAGHEISVHTWSHPYLTTKTNIEVVAELGWTRKAIQSVIGVTPTTMRPPYGDIDDRVRSIALAMGLVPVIWTVSNGVAFDTNDWDVAAGAKTGAQCVSTFESLIGNATELDTGFVVLEHDLFEITVDLAIGYNLEIAQSHTPPFTLQPIGQCNKIPTSDMYRETNTNTSFPYPNSTLATSGSGSSAESTGGSGSSSSKSGAMSLSLNWIPMVMGGLIATVFL